MDRPRREQIVFGCLIAISMVTWGLGLWTSGFNFWYILALAAFIAAEWITFMLPLPKRLRTWMNS